MAAPLHPRVAEVTDRIVARSRAKRDPYLAAIDREAAKGPARKKLGCANFAHGFAACGPGDKETLREFRGPNLGIVTAYNDMLSAHQPYETYPELIREAVRAKGATAQVAGGIPAMCDGVTQGEAGMDLSLFSRDVIALSTGIALSHQMFDAAVYLGICDKIVPGLVIGALNFGHLPAIFLPAGPMTSGMSNDDKSKARQLHAEGKVGRAALLEAESRAYHGPGTCTFYGTANTNQMLMEIMGLHLPGASFINPNTPLRDAMTALGAQRALELIAGGNQYTPIGHVLDERAFVNGIVGLHATGGSTNLTIHLLAMAAAGGITLTWDDFSDLAEVTPAAGARLPQRQGGREPLSRGGRHGLPHSLLARRRSRPWRHPHRLGLRPQGLLRRTFRRLHRRRRSGAMASKESGDKNVLRDGSEPFQPTGGLRVLEGPLGRAVIKTSAVKPERHVIEAPARVFHNQADLHKAFTAGELSRDVVVVVRFQGPKAIGMPELHKLMPPLGVLQDKGHRVALVTDGRLSGASGKVPAAIHVTPEAVAGGAIAKIRDGDMIRLDAPNGRLEILVDAAEFAARDDATEDLSHNHVGVGREMFGVFRGNVGRADQGASIFGGVAA